MGKPANHIEQVVTMFEQVTETGCWIWMGPVQSRGYGHIRIEGTHFLAHRLFYMLANGPIPVDRHIDHICRTKLCVNPLHLEAVTPQENVVRGDSCKLSDADVTLMHQLRSAGENGKLLAALFGVSKQQVYKVTNGQQRRLTRALEASRLLDKAGE